MCLLSDLIQKWINSFNLFLILLCLQTLAGKYFFGLCHSPYCCAILFPEVKDQDEIYTETGLAPQLLIKC